MSIEEKAHGRIETRKLWTSAELQDYLNFPYHRQVMRIERTRLIISSGKEEHEVVYGVTSLSPEKASPQRLMELIRNHWKIENGLHWIRDVTFDEDRSQVRTKNGPRVMAALRNIAISIFNRMGSKNKARTIRCYSRKTHLVLALIGL